MRWHHVRRLYLVLVLSACSSRQTEQQAEPSETPGTASVAPEPGSAAAVDTPSEASVAQNPPLRFGAPPAPAKHAEVFKPRRLSAGRHGQPITRLVISHDGAGVISLDLQNHARLWPALDGSREPLALPLTSPSEIVLDHDATGFAVASLDSAGGLQILDVDNTDMLVAEVSLAADPAYADVVAGGGGFVALRLDHQLDWIDRAGVRGATLSPPHGERIAALLGAPDHVLALVETTEGIHGQWIETAGGKLAWGTATAKLDLDPERAFISPDGTRLVAMRSKRDSPAIFELATGATKSLKTRDPAAPPQFELEVPRARTMDRFTVEPAGKLLGFATNNRVVFSDINVNGGPFAWYDLRGNRVVALSEEVVWMIAADLSVFGGGKAVSFIDRELAVFTPTKASYFGYRTRTARALTATAAGPVAKIGATTLLDDHLRAGKRSEPDTLRVDGDLALVSMRERQTIDDEWLENSQPRRHKVTRVALYDRAKKKELQSWPVGRVDRRVRYEPATRRMVIDHGKTLELATFDPATRAFGPSTKIAVPATTEVRLLDPAQASGDIMISVHGKELRRWRAEDVDRATAPQPSELAAAPELIDRAGHVYVRDSSGTIVVSGPNGDIRIAELKEWKLRPNADGTRIAAFRASAVMLLDGTGQVLWTIGMPGIANLAWTPDGKLLAQARDLVELSPADGSIVYAQCGWSFGKRSTPNGDFVPTDETYCDR